MYWVYIYFEKTKLRRERFLLRIQFRRKLSQIEHTTKQHSSLPPPFAVLCFALTYFLPKCKTGIVLSQQIGVLLSDNDLHQQNISYLDVILLYKNGNWEKILDYRWSWWNWKPNNILHLLIQFSWTEVSTVYIYLGLCVSASCLEIFVLP